MTRLGYWYNSGTSLVPRPHLFLEVGLVNNEHFLGCAESACHMISIATEVRL